MHKMIVEVAVIRPRVRHRAKTDQTLFVDVELQRLDAAQEDVNPVRKDPSTRLLKMEGGVGVEMGGTGVGDEVDKKKEAGTIMGVCWRGGTRGKNVRKMGGESRDDHERNNGSGVGGMRYAHIRREFMGKI